MKNIIIASIVLLSATMAVAQTTQTVRGIITDQTTEQPLIGANVILLNSDPIIGASTDIDGKFELNGVPVGRQSFAVQYIGYRPAGASEVMLTAGKQVIFNFAL